MCIEITREPMMFRDAPNEQCCFCWRPTQFWHTPKDVAVCPSCAQTHEPEEVPDKKTWCAEARKRNRGFADLYMDV